MESFSGYAVRAADCLYDSLAEFEDADLYACTQKMHQIEQEADSSRHEIMRKLSSEAVASISREDIAAIIQAMDTVVDHIDNLLHRMYMFNIHELRSEALPFAQLIIRCCDKLRSAIHEFHSFRNFDLVHEQLVLVSSVESEGDVYHADCMRRLFCEGADPPVHL